jgi:hypothetical protein
MRNRAIRPKILEALEPRRMLSDAAVLRVDAGASAATRDGNGRTWAADRGFAGAAVTNQNNNLIAGTRDDALYATARTGENFIFTAKLPNNTYRVELRFAATASAGVFSVFAEGRPIVQDLDLFTVSGGAPRAFRVVGDVTVADGRLSLRFLASQGMATVSAIAVYPPRTLPPPANLRTTSPGAGQVSLYWDDVSDGERSFVVERALAKRRAKFVPVATVPAGAGTYSDANLPANKRYRYRVRAIGKRTTSDYSDVVDAITAAAPPDAQPSIATTGPEDAGVLHATTSLVITRDNAIIENVDVSGTIEIAARNVYLRNFRIRSNSSFAIKIDDGGSVTIEDGDVGGSKKTAALVTGADFILRRLNLHDSGADAVNPKGVATVDACWIHNLGTAAGTHADGVQIRSGSGFVIRRSYFDMPVDRAGTGSNSAVFIKEDNGPISGVTIDHNWLNGGNYTIYSITADDVTIAHNKFGRNYRYGLLSSKGSVTWAKNYWTDSGAAASP